MVMPNPDQRVMKILVVDDHADTLRAMHHLLNSVGYDVLPASTYCQAIGLAEANRIDLLISDLSLPDGTGLDLMRQVNQMRPTHGIAVSGRGDECDVRACRDAGFELHLTKPTDLPRLLAAIQQVSESEEEPPRPQVE